MSCRSVWTVFFRTIKENVLRLYSCQDGGDVVSINNKWNALVWCYGCLKTLRIPVLVLRWWSWAIWYIDMLMIWRAERNVRKRTKTSQIEWCCEASFNRNYNSTVLHISCHKERIAFTQNLHEQKVPYLLCVKEIISGKWNILQWFLSYTNNNIFIYKFIRNEI